jgi:tetratricopeptide (TPR) repeat protein
MAIILAALVVASLFSRPIAAQDAQANQQPTYTLPEYNAEQAAAAEKDPATKIKMLDAFVAQFPSSTLMQYVYQFYYTAYYQQKNYAKAIEYADKLIALGDKADLTLRVQALQARVQLFGLAFDPKAADAHDQLTKERDAALMGVKLFPDLTKQPNSKVTDDQVKAGIAYLEAAAGTADTALKDYPAAVEALKAALAVNQKDAVTSYRLGVALLAETPPQSLDAFWYLGRAIDLKIPDDTKVKDYLRSRILAYEQPGCPVERIVAARREFARPSRHLYHSQPRRSRQDQPGEHDHYSDHGPERRRGQVENDLARNLRCRVSRSRGQDRRCSKIRQLHRFHGIHQRQFR